jgi:tetratricopeptide (TPR) repeat protein
MTQRLRIAAIAAFCLAVCLPALFAQATGTVKGVCKDATGKPIAGASVNWSNQNTGRKYSLKTNNKGEYFSLGIDPGKYNVSLTQGGNEIFHFENFQVGLEEVTLDFDMQKEQAKQAQGAGLSPEELKKRQDELAKAQKENTTVKALNEKLAAAKTASDAGDFDTAIAQLNEATQMDPNRDLVWFKLGEAQRNSAMKQTDKEEKTKRLTEAANDYQKAVDLKQKSFDASAKKPEDAKQLGAYYNNLGDAYSKAGKIDDAVKTYAQAAQVNPEGSAGYYYNMGAVLTNAGKIDDAIAAFDKAIAADPTKPDPYYQKGVNLVGKAKTDASGKVTPAPGTAEAFNKYLELAPDGPYAEPAKSMLQYIGSTVETSFGKKKPAKK